MDIIDGMELQETFCVYMERGDDFVECIREAAKQKEVEAGVVLSAAATFDRARIHYITHTEFPPHDKFVSLEGPLELCSVDGIIAGYEPHMHCTMALRGGELFAGHMEPGCRVLYLAEVVIAKFAGRMLQRGEHPDHGTPQLQAEDQK